MTESNNSILFTLKKLSTHLHFFSIFFTLLCAGWLAPDQVWPNCLSAVAATFVIAYMIPPRGMLKPDEFQGNTKAFIAPSGSQFVDKDAKSETKSKKSEKKSK